MSRGLGALRAVGARILDRTAYWLDCAWSALKGRDTGGSGAHMAAVYFHAVLDRSGAQLLDPQEGITPDFLREFIRSMKQAGYAFVTPDVAFSPDRPEGNLALLTSDDGYRSVGLLLPVLEAEAAPLTVFLGTDYSLRDGVWWWDQLHMAGRSTAATRAHLKHGVTSRRARDEALRHLGLDPQATAFSDSHRLLSPIQVEQLSRSQYFAFGNHTRSHLSLPLLDEAEVQDEVEGARQEMETWTGGSIRDFAFPYGDHDARTVSLLSRWGYRALFTTEPGHCPIEGAADMTGVRVVPRYRLRADRSAACQARIVSRGVTVGTRLQAAAIRRVKTWLE